MFWLVSSIIISLILLRIQSSSPKVLFRRQNYERTVEIKKLQTGSPIIQVELDGAERDAIRFVIIEGNPGWLAIEEFGGSVYVAPRHYDARDVNIFKF